MVPTKTGVLEGAIDVRFGSLADISQCKTPCPLYPRKRTLGTTVGMSALCQQLTLSACPDLLSNLLDVRQLPHLVEERLGWGVGAEHDFEATFGIGRRPLSARSGQMHRSKQHPRWQAGVWTSEAERRRPPSDLPERCRRRRVIAMTARAVGARPHTRLALSVA